METEVTPQHLIELKHALERNANDPGLSNKTRGKISSAIKQIEGLLRFGHERFSYHSAPERKVVQPNVILISASQLKFLEELAAKKPLDVPAQNYRTFNRSFIGF